MRTPMTFINLGQRIVHAEAITWIEFPQDGGGGFVKFGESSLPLSVEELELLLRRLNLAPIKKPAPRTSKKR